MLHQFFIDFIALNLDIEILYAKGRIFVRWPGESFEVWEVGGMLLCINASRIGVRYGSTSELINFFTSKLSK